MAEQTYKRVEMTDEEETLFFERIMQEVELKEKARAMTDGQLSRALIREVWATLHLWTPAGVLVDEAITRLKRADTQRRWDAREVARSKRQGQCFFCGATTAAEGWAGCVCNEREPETEAKDAD